MMKFIKNNIKYLFHILGLLIVLSSFPVQQGCADMKIKKAQKRAVKVQEKQERKAIKAHEKVVKRQKKIQTDETKQRIKNNKKRSNKYNDKRRKERKFFLWRWLGF